MLACLALAGGVAFASAQATEPAETPRQTPKEAEAEKPDVVVEDDRNAYDRPTSYPQIRFGSRPAAKNGAEGEKAAPRTRVYLIDVSEAMANKMDLGDAGDLTRLAHMRSLVEKGLDALARRDVRFNLVTFGQINDFAKGGDLKTANAESIGLAKEWLNGLKAEGKPDLYALLAECFKQEPDEATLIVGSMPNAPAGVTENDLKIAGGAGEYIIRRVAALRAGGKRTTLDITGVGLGADEKKFYQRLAQAGGGAYLDG